LVGLEMAFAYLGMSFMPPVFGLIAQYGGVGFYPVYLLIFILLLWLTSERCQKSR
jgi:fucose permease